jgi:cytochrome c2
MKRFRFSFTTGLVALGFLLTAVVAVDLAARGLHRHPQDRQWPMPEGDADRGRQAILAHGCGACHVVPGIRSAAGRVGPKLEDFRNQIYIGGVLANEPDNLIRWIQDPPRYSPETAMPNLGVSEHDARDIAAYLYFRD